MALAAMGASPALAETVRVRITDLAFSSAEITVHKGDTVEWVNDDVFDHTATDKNEKWDVAIPAGKTGQLAMQQAGTFDYFCRFHPNMTGTIRVVDK